MGKSRSASKTTERILETSTRLFFEKGYEQTSIQDILNELSDLTKGAIYHHFKSKEDIFDTIVQNLSRANSYSYINIKNNSTLTGAEKLKELIKIHISSEETKEIVKLSPSLLDNPKFLAIQIKMIRDVITPEYIFPIVDEGIADGSINSDKPYELAEIITVIINVWLNPLILGDDRNNLHKKCAIVNELLERYNIVLFDEHTISELTTL